MKKAAFFVAVGMIAASATAFTLVSQEWNVDVPQAKINFTLPKGDGAGTLSGLKAKINFNPADPAASQIEATVDVSTINTGISGRDEHLKQTDFFDAAKFPQIKFVSEKITKTEKGFIASGQLTMRDSTRAVEMPFTFEPKGELEGVFKGTMEIFAGDYGVMKKSKSGKDLVVITMEVPVKK